MSEKEYKVIIHIEDQTLFDGKYPNTIGKYIIHGRSINTGRYIYKDFILLFLSCKLGL